MTMTRTALLAVVMGTAASLALADDRIIIAPPAISAVPAKQVIDRVADMGYQQVLEFERKGDVVEVEAVDADGREVRLYFDSDSGAPIE